MPELSRSLVVSMVTNGRNPELLEFVVRTWMHAGGWVGSRGVPVYLCVISSAPVLNQLATALQKDSSLFNQSVDTRQTSVYAQFYYDGSEFGREDHEAVVLLVEADVSPQNLGRARDAYRSALDEILDAPLQGRVVHPDDRFVVLHTDDDIIPLTSVAPLINTPDDAIQAVKLIGVVGGRWFDWATHVAGHSQNQPYTEHSPHTYITLASQCAGHDVQRTVNYSDMGGFRQKQDVKYCRAAVAAGFRLLPPQPDVVLCHLDRK